MKDNSTLQILLNAIAILGGGVVATMIVILLDTFDIMDSQVAKVGLGIGFCAIAILASRTAKDRALDAMKIAFYFAGLYMFLDMADEPYQSVIMSAVLAITFFISKKNILPFVSVVAFNYYSVQMVVTIFSADSLLGISLFNMIWLSVVMLLNHYESCLIIKLKIPYSHYKALQGGLFATIVLSLVSLQLFSVSVLIQTSLMSLPQIIIPLATAYMVLKIIRKLEVRCLFQIISVVTSLLVMCALTLGAISLAISILLVLMAWCYGYRIQAAVAAVLVSYFIGQAYYDMEISLLLKSATLFFSGILLLMGWGIYMKNMKK